MTSFLWFLTRSSGVVALVLMLAAVADGLLFSGRSTGRRLRPAWWMDLHRGLGGYALAFTGLHLAAAFGADIGVGLTEIFVPGAADWSTGAFTWGVIATYLMALTVFTTWPRRRLRRRAWHAVHLLSVPAAAMAVIHAVQLGSDAFAPWFVGVLAVTVGIATYPLVLRLLGATQRALAVPSPAPVAARAVRATTPPSGAPSAPSISGAPSAPSISGAPSAPSTHPAPVAANRRHDRDEVLV